MHGTESPSDWVQKWAHLAQPKSHVLDIACGAGRHMQFFKQMGHQCLGLDRSAEALSHAKAFGEVIEADIESSPWPLEGQQFNVVVVTHYLWRPIMPRILQSVAPGGLLIYETFSAGHEKVGKPSRPDFLLKTGELLQTFAALRVIAFEDGYLREAPKYVQRIVAVHQVHDSDRQFDLSCR